MAAAAPRILILRFSSLGDVVLASSLLDGVLEAQPGARIVLVTKAQFAPLFAADPRLERVESLERGRGAFWSLLARLERFDADLILDAHASLRSRMLTMLLPPTRLRRVQKDAAQRLAFVYGRLRTPALRSHQLHRFAALTDDRRLRLPRLHVPEGAAAAASTRLGESTWIAVAPGARHATKQWLSDRFAAVAREFCQRHGARVLVIGSAEERTLCADVATSIGDAALDLSGELDLGRLAAHLARCRLLICNDSGLLHLAEAVGTPVLALFGPTSREFGFFPSLETSAVVEHALACRPCSRTGARACRMPERWCMTRSTVELVSSQLELQWQRLAHAASN